MANSLDFPLEELIKRNKQQSGNSNRSSGLGGGGGTGPARRFNNRAATRSAPYNSKGADAAAWQHDGYVDQMAAAAAMRMGGGGGIETGTKLYISNLDYAVSNEDIKELFAEVGDLKRYSINYDRSGRSKGTAEVVFARRSDALAAVKRYNNVQLDGKPMKIEVIGTNLETPAPAPFAFSVPFANFNGPVTSGPGGWASRGGGGFGSRGRGGRGGGRGRGRGRGKPVSAEDLDAELDKYHAEAMHIN